MKRQVFNPYLPLGEYVPDGEPHVFGDRVYIYGSHDRFGGNAYCENDYVCWSAPVTDLSDWKYEGIIYKRKQDSLNRLGRLAMWAPDVVHGPDGKYYLYYCLAFHNAIGVAAAESAAGPFAFLGHVQYADGTYYGRKKGDTLPFDPAVLHDGGRVFLYSNYSNDHFINPFLKLNGNGCSVLELKTDMLTLVSVKPLIPGISNAQGTGFEGHEFYEASSIRKVGEKFYFVYSSFLSHELCYAVSDQPDSGFVYGGSLISNGDIGYQGISKEDARNFFGNNHGGMECINGQWYIFHHRQTHCDEHSRQGCAEPITILEDGSIQMVEMTSCGLNGQPLAGTGTYPAAIACNLVAKEGARKFGEGFPLAGSFHRKFYPHISQEVQDIAIPEYGKSTQYICNMQDGTTAGFKYFDVKNISEITVSIRGSSGEVSISLALHGESVGIAKFSESRQWQRVTIPVTIPTGKQGVFVTYHGTGKIDFLDLTLC